MVNTIKELEQKLPNYLNQIKNRDSEEGKKYYCLRFLEEIFDVGAGEDLDFEVATKTASKLRGRADTLFQNLILEFKKDAKNSKAIDDGEIELKKYLQHFKEKEPTETYVGIITDGIIFKPYQAIIEKNKVTNLSSTNQLDISKASPDDIFLWFDTYFYKLDKIKLTSKTIKQKFGLGTDTFVKIRNDLKILFEKVRTIIQNNIFGVDINEEAIEITQLNLFLKLATSSKQLPDVSKNLRVGNALIDDKSVDPKAFDWKQAFPEKFDIVIGNPPYIRQEKIGHIKSNLEKFEVYDGYADIFVYFFEKSISLLKNEGNLGFIVSNKWLKAKYGKNLREFLSKYYIEKIIDFGDTQIFKGATTYPCVINLKKTAKENQEIKIKCVDKKSLYNIENILGTHDFEFNQRVLDSSMWNFQSGITQKILNKILENSITLKNFCKNQFYKGITTGSTESFILDEKTKNKIINEDPNTAAFLKPVITGKEVNRYYVNLDTKKFLLLIPWSYDLEFSTPIKKHLLKYKKKLEMRPEVKEGRYNWWCLSRYGSQTTKFMPEPKIIYGLMVTKPKFVLDIDGLFLNNANFFIPVKDYQLLAILNSKLGWFLIQNYCTRIQGGYQLTGANFGQIPIAKNKSEKLVNSVQKIIDLKNQLKNSTLKKQLEKKIELIDNEIGELVYKLYNITEEEKKIIESSL